MRNKTFEPLPAEGSRSTLSSFLLLRARSGRAHGPNDSAETAEDEVMMSELAYTKNQTQECKAMRDNIRRVVESLEVCWKCQRVSPCQKYVLGNVVLVWLCKGCVQEMEQPRPRRTKKAILGPAIK